MLKFSILLLALTLVCSDKVPEPSNNLTRCIDAIKVLPKDVMTVIEAIKAFDIEKAITAVTDLVADVKKAFAECLGKKDLTVNWGAFKNCIFSARVCYDGRTQILEYFARHDYASALRVFWQYVACFESCKSYL